MFMNSKKKWVSGVLISSIGMAPLTGMTGCEQLPGDEKTQGAVIGGAGGALAGALLGGEDNRLLGGLIGGVLGAAGGYVIGTQIEKNRRGNDDDYQDAVQASERDRRNPPKTSDVRKARTADLNDDGFVTLNEVVAMEDAGLSTSEMINRLEDTGQVFYLSESQEEYLRDKGVPSEVIRAMRTMNRDRTRAVSDSD